MATGTKYVLNYVENARNTWKFLLYAYYHYYFLYFVLLNNSMMYFILFDWA